MPGQFGLRTFILFENLILTQILEYRVQLDTANPLKRKGGVAVEED